MKTLNVALALGLAILHISHRVDGSLFSDIMDNIAFLDRSAFAELKENCDQGGSDSVSVNTKMLNS